MLTSRVLPKIAKNIITRNTATYGMGNGIAAPPLNRVPFIEKFTLGMIMTSSLLFVPAWVLVHLQDYKNKE